MAGYLYTEGLSVGYGGRPLLEHIALSVRRGEIVTLIGPNGAGKSTVMGIISRLIARDAGLVDFEGKDIAKWKSKELSKRLAILTQSNSIQMKLTVRELVTFGRFPYSGGRTTPEDQRIIDQAIAYMELEEFQDRFIDELSGGQRQRALIAMVIAQDTEYVLLDEPTNNLDIYHATNMMRTVRKLCDELGKTVILVLHEINYAAFYSDYICAFVDGKVAKFGTVEEVMTKENLSAIYQVDFEILEIEGKPLSIYYIFIGGRLASSYDALSEIAPVVYLSTDTEQGVVESVRKNANIIASLFGLEEEVDSLMADFDSRIAALAEFAEGKTAIVGLVTSGGFNVLGNDGRCSMICREVGFENIGVDAEIDTATHGNEASFEFVVEKDPDYIFVLDRDAAIQTEGAQLAQEIVENELVKGTRAYTDGHIVYLSSPAVWYTAEGGITALDVMLQDLESELLSQ